MVEKKIISRAFAILYLRYNYAQHDKHQFIIQILICRWGYTDEKSSSISVGEGLAPPVKNENTPRTKCLYTSDIFWKFVGATCGRQRQTTKPIQTDVQSTPLPRLYVAILFVICIYFLGRSKPLPYHVWYISVICAKP